MAKGFQKGNSLGEGRPKGATNKTTSALRESITDFLNENFEKVKADFNVLAPKDRTKFYVDLLNFGLPKLSTVQISEDRQTESVTIRLPDNQLITL